MPEAPGLVWGWRHSATWSATLDTNGAAGSAASTLVGAVAPVANVGAAMLASRSVSGSGSAAVGISGSLFAGTGSTTASATSDAPWMLASAGLALTASGIRTTSANLNAAAFANNVLFMLTALNTASSTAAFTAFYALYGNNP